MVMQIIEDIRNSFSKRSGQKLQKQIVSPYPVDPEEYKKGMEATKIERDWYSKYQPYADNVAIHDAIRTGALVKVEPSSNYLPIMRFRNPDLVDKYPPYLNVSAKKLLEEIASEWRNALDAAGYSKEIRLAVTSLVRTTEYQNFLLEEGRFAQPDSPHTHGEAFDIDSAGYYIGENPMNPRTSVNKMFEDSFQKMSKKLTPMQMADLSKHDPKITLILKDILMHRQEEGHLHFIIEFAGTENEIFHICRNPEYHPGKI